MAEKVKFYKGFAISTKHVRVESYPWLQKWSEFSDTVRRSVSGLKDDMNQYSLSVTVRRMPGCPEEVRRILDWADDNDCEVVDIGYFCPVVEEFPVYPREAEAECH